ncbi:MAG: hypothetical protein H3C58_09930 [Fimbriimonadaceae bacterium]|nr:hypothetical protein [Fimbriimonadaceae bacterium]
MNREKLVKNIGQLVLLQPAPIRLDRHGRAIRDIRDPWRLEGVSGQVARLTNTLTDHFVDLGLDQIYSYGSDPNAKNIGEHHTGLLQLKVQLAISGPKVTVQSTVRPGEPILPPAGTAPRVVVTFEEFAKDGPTYFRTLWGKRNGDLWASLGRRVEAFDRKEGDQIGSVGYVARLDSLLQTEIATASKAILSCALQVHQELGMPLEQAVEDLLLELAGEYLRVFYKGLPGFAARHMGRYGVRRDLGPRALTHAEALAEVHVLNSIREYFRAERSISKA